MCMVTFITIEMHKSIDVCIAVDSNTVSVMMVHYLPYMIVYMYFHS